MIRGFLGQVFAIVHHFGTVAQDGGGPWYGGLTQGADGNLYGTTRGGGTGFGLVFQIAPDGTYAVLYRFSGGPNDGEQPIGSLIQATDGNLYGVTLAGGAFGQGTVYQLTLP